MERRQAARNITRMVKKASVEEAQGLISFEPKVEEPDDFYREDEIKALDEDDEDQVEIREMDEGEEIKIIKKIEEPKEESKVKKVVTKKKIVSTSSGKDGATVETSKEEVVYVDERGREIAETEILQQEEQPQLSEMKKSQGEATRKTIVKKKISSVSIKSTVNQASQHKKTKNKAQSTR